MTRVFVVRHGNTFAPGEPPRRIGARTDLPLVASGRHQADALGRHFAGEGIAFARARTSPLRRCRETAAAILRHQPAAVRCTPARWLAEIDHGPDEDRPEADVVARVGAAALSAWEAGGPPPDGWTVDAPRRIAGWRRWLARLPAGDFLAVTSNGAARFCRESLSLGPAGSWKLATGAYGVIERGGDGRFSLRAWNVRPDPGAGDEEAPTAALA